MVKNIATGKIEKTESWKEPNRLPAKIMKTNLLNRSTLISFFRDFFKQIPRNSGLLTKILRCGELSSGFL